MGPRRLPAGRDHAARAVLSPGRLRQNHDDPSVARGRHAHQRVASARRRRQRPRHAAAVPRPGAPRLSPLDAKVLMWLALPEPPIQGHPPHAPHGRLVRPPFILVLDDAHLVRDPCWRMLGGILVELPRLGGFAPCTQRPADPHCTSGASGLVAEYGFAESRPSTSIGRARSLFWPSTGSSLRTPWSRPWSSQPRAGRPACTSPRSPGEQTSDGPRPLPSGERREIADYLTAEVLADRPAETSSGSSRARPSCLACAPSCAWC